jgi:hypothetical protein
MKKAGVAAVAALAVLVGERAQAADSFQGTVTYGEETLAIVTGYAVVAAGESAANGPVLSFALFSKPLPTSTVAPTTTGEVNDMDSMGPRVVIELDTRKGSTAATAATYTGCRVKFLGFEGGPYVWSDNAPPKPCGLTGVSGTLQPGSPVTARLEGQNPGFPPHVKASAWNVTVATTARGKR